MQSSRELAQPLLTSGDIARQISVPSRCAGAVLLCKATLTTAASTATTQQPTLLLLCCAVLCCAVLCCAVLCCAVLCCAVLCCAVLCCAVLCCVVLCCVVPKALLPEGKGRDVYPRVQVNGRAVRVARAPCVSVWLSAERGGVGEAWMSPSWRQPASQELRLYSLSLRLLVQA